MFVLRYGDRIRRRLGGRLGPQMRRVFDSEDILSTVLRRLDVYLMDHDLLATNDNQLMSLIYRIADSAVVDKVRLSVKLRDLFGAEGGAADSAASQDGGLDDDAQMGVIFDAIDDPQDRVMVWMLLTDRSFEQIGQALDVPSATLRKRWQRLRERLSSKLTERAA
ncbi:MAG: sigma-70 family RNA polymerase sigma factor [Phycisphaeraceae bacterium]|nr:MAG: sigma-70 family RNA polymerase sigma factor [Phycisphaeraceae bacterium]